MLNKTIKTYSQIYQNYASINVLNNNMFKLLAEYIGLLKGKDILDVGCAGGRDSKYFSDKGFNVTGIDLTLEFLELAKINCPKCTFKLMDMRKLDFPQKSFDGVWACASFLHLYKKDALKTLKGFRKVLKPDGVLFLSVMEGDFNGIRVNQKLNWGERHFSDYQTKEIEKLFNTANFKVIDLIKTQTSWGPMFLNYFCQAI